MVALISDEGDSVTSQSGKIAWPSVLAVSRGICRMEQWCWDVWMTGREALGREPSDQVKERAWCWWEKCSNKPKFTQWQRKHCSEERKNCDVKKQSWPRPTLPATLPGKLEGKKGNCLQLNRLQLPACSQKTQVLITNLQTMRTSRKLTSEAEQTVIWSLRNVFLCCPDSSPPCSLSDRFGLPSS